MAAASPPGHDDRRIGRIGRVWLSGILVAVAAAFLFPQALAAADSQIDTPTTIDYVPTTSIGAQSLDVSAFSPQCVGEAPYVSYAIKPIGFTSSGPATLTFYDMNGNFVEKIVVPTLSGQVVYPGASVDANGNATDWPGWTQAPNGSWIPDDSDADLREGVTVKVEVNPTATAAVSYPPATSSCFGPPNGTTPTTTICVEPRATGGDPACTLPRTGSDSVGRMMAIGAIALAAGAAFALVARRRKGVTTA